MAMPVGASAPRMSEDGLFAIMKNIRFRDWTFKTARMGHDGWYLQVHIPTVCTDTGAPCIRKGRKWYISQYSIRDEVVKTAWLAVRTALEHEAMEDFKYRNMAVFHPHTDVVALHDLQLQGRRVSRPNPTGGPTE